MVRGRRALPPHLAGQARARPRRHRRRLCPPAQGRRRPLDAAGGGHRGQYRRGAPRTPRSRSCFSIRRAGRWRRGGPRSRSRPCDRAVAHLSLESPSPTLWSVESPTLYTVRTTVRQDGAAGGRGGDALRLPHAAASIRTSGFFLNDQPVKLQGVCIHQDHAGRRRRRARFDHRLPPAAAEGDGLQRHPLARTMRRPASCSTPPTGWASW